MSDVGKRIREERERLGLNQSSVGVSQKTQWAYEAGKSTPDTSYLENFAKLGADIGYIVTGQRSGGALDPRLQRILDAWRQIPQGTQDWLLALIERDVGAGPVLTANTDSEVERR